MSTAQLFETNVGAPCALLSDVCSLVLGEMDKNEFVTVAYVEYCDLKRKPDVQLLEVFLLTHPSCATGVTDTTKNRRIIYINRITLIT